MGELVAKIKAKLACYNRIHSHLKRDGKLFLHQTRVIARNTCLNLNQNDYICT